MRDRRPMPKQYGDVARKRQVEPGRPHPVAEPKDTCERPRRDAVRDRKTMEPA